MKKLSLLSFLFIILSSCKQNIKPLRFSELNFILEEDAIVEVNVPNASGEPKIAKAINSSIKNLITNMLAMDSNNIEDFSIKVAADRFNKECKKHKQTSPNIENTWEAFIDGEITYESSEIISMAFNVYKNTGAVTGRSFIVFLNFNPQDGEFLKKEKLYYNKHKFTAFIEKQFKKTIDSAEQRFAYFFKQGFKLPDSFGFSEDGLIVLYNNFELYEFDGNITEFTIPYKKVNQYLTVN